MLQPVDAEEQKIEMLLAFYFAIHICCRVCVFYRCCVLNNPSEDLSIVSTVRRQVRKFTFTGRAEVHLVIILSSQEQIFSGCSCIDHSIRLGFPKVRHPWLWCAHFTSKLFIGTVFGFLWAVKDKSNVAWNLSSYCFLCWYIKFFNFLSRVWSLPQDETDRVTLFRVVSTENRKQTETP